MELTVQNQNYQFSFYFTTYTWNNSSHSQWCTIWFSNRFNQRFWSSRLNFVN